MTIKVRGCNWLAEVGKIKPGEYVHLSDLDGLTRNVAQDAIDSQYGNGYVWLHDHGTIFWGVRRASSTPKGPTHAR